MNFGSHTDSVVHATAELVNVLTPGERQGHDYDPSAMERIEAAIGVALRAADRRVREPDPGLVSDFTDLAVAARAVFEETNLGNYDAAAAAVNRMLATYQPSPALERHDDEPWHIHFHGPESLDPTGWGGGSATSLATVVGSEYADRLGVCAAPRCDRVFVDVSRNGTKRFCSEACQSRVKAAAHRARRHKR